MRRINPIRASIASFIIWVIGVSAFAGSYFLPIMENPDEQANWFLTFALIPAIILGVNYYNKKGFQTDSLLLGAYMFFLTMVLDALITVPFFIIPAGGDHLSFFGDPGFWMLGIEYMLVVATANYLFSKK